MNRRDLIASLATAAAWPLSGYAQQKAMPVIGFLSSATRDADEPMSRHSARASASPVMSSLPPRSLPVVRDLGEPHRGCIGPKHRTRCSGPRPCARSHRQRLFSEFDRPRSAQASAGGLTATLPLLLAIRLLGPPMFGHPTSKSLSKWSGRWDSNPRPRPWQACYCRVRGFHKSA